METIKLCTQLHLPSELRTEANMRKLLDHPLSDPRPTVDHILPGPGGPSELAMPLEVKWKNGSTLRVRFLNGSETIKGKIKYYANQWSDYANIKFDFVDSGDAEIRINIDLNRRSNSYMGVWNLLVDKDKPTMNYGWLTDHSQDSEFRSVVLHEFGHALGLTHEHLSPAADIKWNKPVVYDYYERYYGWTKETVDWNLFHQWDANTTEFTAFDPQSIMVYSIESFLTTDGFSVEPTTDLSDMDKAFIQQLYPPPDVDVAVFNTLEIRRADQPAQNTSKTQKFSRKYEQAPLLALGLNWLEVASGANIRVNAFADNITNASADLHLDTWSNTTLYSAGCTWLRKAANDPDFQLGKFSTMEDHAWQDRQIKTSRKITFARPYGAPPRVIVWLNQLDISYNTVWKIQATATDVTPEGFTMNLDSGDETWLASATAAWIAYPSDKKGVASGSFDTTSPQPPDQSLSTKSGTVEFPEGIFQRIPTVLVAFSSLDADYRQDLRVKVLADSESEKGIKWQITSWGNTVMNFAGASYIALE